MDLKPLIFVTILACTACHNSQVTSLPISEEKMVKVLFDVHVAEASLAAYPGSPAKDSIANQLYEQVAEMHEIDRPTLDSSLVILQRNPELAKNLYEKVMEMVEKQSLEK